ncbi:MAG: enoyl-CoA hydratase/isomerase family protein, partial [Pseudomonadota bacterium]|nr:enoyl-CoA hydratase/isomerase family protein [Pseudomonadota bacterium]
MCESPYSALRYRVAEGIAHIVLDRPPLNLIDEVLTREYHDALQRAEASTDCRVIILSGSGRGLSGGLDIKFVEAFGQEKMEQFLRLFYVDTLAICRSLSKPLITMVQGYAREGACTLAFAGDLII